jgi:hypothetical protein
MAYSAEINRRRPALLLLMIDQSTSMEDSWAGIGASKAEALAEAVNKTLSNAIALCSKGTQRVYDYFQIGVLGYGAEISHQLPGTRLGEIIVSIGDLARSPKRVEQRTAETVDGAGRRVLVEQPFAVWVDPVAYGMTPMTAAFRAAEPVVASWCSDHADSFPPLVVNITDGESTDGDPTAAAERIMSLGTNDGAALVFNVHLSGIQQEPFAYPSSAAGLPNDNAELLFGMSSELPPGMFEAARGQGLAIDTGARGFLYNADATTVFKFLDLGTRAVTPTGLKELTTGLQALGQ